MMSGPRAHFVTFADAKYAGSLRRICREARVHFHPDRIHCFDDAVLRTSHPDFWERHGDFIAREKRGFGYWIWKPYVILKTMECAREGDVVVYADAGCTLNARPEAQERMTSLVQCAAFEQDGLVCFTVPDFYRPEERRWTKRVVLDYFGVSDDENKNSAQIMATTLIIKNTPKNRRLIRSWYELCSMYDLVNDNAGAAQEDPMFEDHRHDQSIWSMLIKTTRRDDAIVIDNDVEFHHAASPIWATRKKH
jgi:hypothetical protein